MIVSEVDALLDRCLPSQASNCRRREISTFIRQIIEKTYGLEVLVVGTGSYTLRSYLPEADIDLVVFISPFEGSERFTDNTQSVLNKTSGSLDSNGTYNNSNTLKLTLDIFTSICYEISNSNASIHQNSNKIRNLEFINAKTPLAHCVVNNVHVDITVNQIGAVATVAFLEEVDRYIGKNHFFKRSLLLVKCWCLNESRKYCGYSIMGSKNGMLSSYALSVMVLHVFNNKYDILEHPFDVLRSFLCTFSTFAWDECILTVNGHVPINTTAIKISNPANKFEALLNQFIAKVPLRPSLPGAPVGPVGPMGPYVTSSIVNPSIKCCNIQDPLDGRNNLSAAITGNNLSIIDRAFKLGYQHLESTLVSISNTNNTYIPVGINANGIPVMINNLMTANTNSSANKQFDNWFLRIFFPASYALYMQEDAVRSDLCDHPLSTNVYYVNPDDDSNVNVLECDVDSIWTSLTKAIDIVSSPVSISKSSLSQSRPEYKRKTTDSISRSHSPISAVSVLSDTDGGLTSGYSDCYLSDSSICCIDEDAIDDIEASSGVTSKVTGIADDRFGCSTHNQTSVQTQTETEEVNAIYNSAIETTSGSSRVDQTTVNNITRARSKNKFKKKQKGRFETISAYHTLPDTVVSNSNEYEHSDVDAKNVFVSKQIPYHYIFTAIVICGLGVFMATIYSYYCTNYMNELNPMNSSVSSCYTPVILSEVSSASSKISNHVISHWVKSGESITFGDQDFLTALNKLDFIDNSSDSDMHATLFQWYKDGINITEPSKSQLYVTINKMRPSDQGRYQCIVVTGKYTGLVVAETYLQISTSPMSKTKQSYQELVQGSNLVLQIAADGSPPLYHKWFKNGIPIDDDISKSDKLIIYNVTKSNSGTYSCEISNFAGNYLWLEATVYVKNTR